MLTRRRFLRTVGVSLLATPLVAEAQQVRTRRVGILSPGVPETSPLLEAFRRGLRDLGYLEGQNMVFEYRFAETRLERLPALATELVERRVDVIFAINGTAAQAAANATKTIPIVFTWVADPAALVKNLGRPDGNVTGLSSFATELSGKRLELLKAAVPGASRIAILWNPGVPLATSMARHMEGAGAQLGVRLYPVPVGDASALPEAFKIAVRERVGALFVIEEATLLTHRARILSLAELHRLPAASQYREFAEAGGLLSYGPDLPDLFRQASIYVDRIFRGAKPADLPVEQPTKFELAINLKTAKALGLTIPQSLLVRASQLIE